MISFKYYLKEDIYYYSKEIVILSPIKFYGAALLKKLFIIIEKNILFLYILIKNGLNKFKFKILHIIFNN